MSTCTPTQRCESWDNYCNLFGVILHGNVNMQLPNLWLWEMIDEFIYQFQSFCQYRGKAVPQRRCSTLNTHVEHTSGRPPMLKAKGSALYVLQLRVSY